MSRDFRRELGERVLVADGGMGTSIQFARPDPDDFAGHEGLNEWLNLTRPDLIGGIHADFLAAGSDIVETNSFGAFPVVLAEYGLQDEAERLAAAAARIAREAADSFATADRPRFVAGSMGPGTRLPSLGHISYSDLAEAYRPLADGLIAGGCDLLLIETCQDLLQLRAALAAARAAMRRAGRDLPVGLQITVETAGTMLLGTETEAAVAALLPLKPDFIGMNCATGPDMMRDHLRAICARSPVPVSVLPNAGLPRNVDGAMVYDVGPDDFADAVAAYVDDPGVGLVGGCCGTTSEHVAALAARVSGRPAPRRDAAPDAALSSLYQAVALDQRPRPLLVGERTNANGSRRFRELQAAGDLDGMAAMAVDQQNEGAHVLDVCTAYVGRDEPADMDAFCARLNTEAQLPVMIDSTDPLAIRAALERLGGRCVVNSINLEDGEARPREVLELCREFGAAVVALCIDEQGMARTADRKLEAARRLADLCAEYGLTPRDILFDPLTFTLASGDSEYDLSARETLQGLRLIKSRIPGARTLLGLSNVSFGLKPRIRRVLNSVFLERALEAGLDAAILHAGRILGADEVPAELRRACERLIDGDRDGEDPLAVLLEAEMAPDVVAESEAALPVADRLRRRIIQGRSDGLAADLDEALLDSEPLAIINDVLLDGMREVGELFGAGRLQLPFVLKSAETMKAAVRHLEPRMERSEAAARGRFMIATVKGDVHDIGKNLVDIILTNNGFTVDNLGIKVPVEQLIEAIRRDEPQAVGMSGLLVKSTVVMKENLEAMRRAGIDLPVILGGAALTRAYVERDLRRVYDGPVYYARDAFAGLELVGGICAGDPPPAPPRDDANEALAGPEPAPGIVPPAAVEAAPEPPFWGARKVAETDIELDRVWELLNLPALVKGRWGYTRAGMPKEDYLRLQRMEIEPALARLKRSASEDRWLRPAAVRGWFAAEASGDELLVYADPGDDDPAWKFAFPRQRKSPRRCLSDYFGGRGPGGRDVLGVMAVTVGPEATERARELMEADDYSEYLLLHGFAVETAEALAEHVHRLMRRELGIDDGDAADPADLIRAHYRGRRYSFGYPACPELADQRILAEMLRWENVGISLSEECQLHPEQSVSAIVVHHPEAEYFSI